MTSAYAHLHTNIQVPVKALNKFHINNFSLPKILFWPKVKEEKFLSEKNYSWMPTTTTMLIMFTRQNTMIFCTFFYIRWLNNTLTKSLAELSMGNFFYSSCACDSTRESIKGPFNCIDSKENKFKCTIGKSDWTLFFVGIFCCICAMYIFVCVLVGAIHFDRSPFSLRKCQLKILFAISVFFFFF